MMAVLAARRAGSDGREARDEGVTTADVIAELKQVFRTARTVSDGLRFADHGRRAVAIDDEYSAFCAPWESPLDVLSIGEPASDSRTLGRPEAALHVAGFWPSPAQRRSWLLRVAPADVVEGHTIRLAGLGRMPAPPVALSVRMSLRRAFSTESGARGWIRIDHFSCPPTDVAFAVNALLGSQGGGRPLAVRGEFRAVFAPVP